MFSTILFRDVSSQTRYRRDRPVSLQTKNDAVNGKQKSLPILFSSECDKSLGFHVTVTCVTSTRSESSPCKKWHISDTRTEALGYAFVVVLS